MAKEHDDGDDTEELLRHVVRDGKRIIKDNDKKKPFGGPTSQGSKSNNNGRNGASNLEKKIDHNLHQGFDQTTNEDSIMESDYQTPTFGDDEGPEDNKKMDDANANKDGATSAADDALDM